METSASHFYLTTDCVKFIATCIFALYRTENVYFSPNVSCWEIPFNSITFRDILGSGAFGEVWKAVARGIKGISGETEVAVKKLKRKK